MVIHAFKTNIIGELSPKQIEVLDLILDRRTNKEIAVLLNISASAVEQRLQSARRKLGAVGRADLARAYEAALKACQKPIDEKFQVDQDAEKKQLKSGISASDLRGQAGDPEGATLGHVRRRKSDLSSSFLNDVDRTVGVVGRVAVLLIAASALALIVLIVMFVDG